MDASFVESEEEIVLAEYLAKKSFKTKPIAKQFRFEFLLWLAGTKDIKSALKKTEVKDKALILSPHPLPLPRAQLKKRANALAIERISLSRL